MQPDLQNKDYVLQRQLKPEARKDIIDLFESKGIIPTSMIDVSDGLSSELLHLCQKSKVGCTIYQDKLPVDFTAISIADDFNMSSATCALNVDEYNKLLFTISQEHYEAIKNDPDLTIIGHITEESQGAVLITKDQHHQALTAQGWKSFS
jgi:thiamine-monophosphate kinase